MRRFVVKEGLLAAGSLELELEVASHLRDVLRFRGGEKIVLSDGAGWEMDAEVTVVSRRGVSVRGLGERRVLPPPSGMTLSLIQCVAKGDKMDQVVRQAVELGVREIFPVISERSVAEKRSRAARWRAIAEDAIRVSGRAHRPQIAEVEPLEALLARPRVALSVCLAGLGGATLRECLAREVAIPSSAEALIGPEGGLSERELELADSSGFSVVRLGPHTLRTETAGPAVAAIMLYWSGAIAG